MNAQTEILNPKLDLGDLAPFGLIQLDARRRVVAANAEAQALLGHSERALQARPLSEVIFHDSPLFELIDRALQVQSDLSAYQVPVHGPGLKRRFTLDVRLRPMGEGGVLLGFVEAKGHEPSDVPASLASFGRILGHEVKNPLAGILGAAQLLLRQAYKEQAPLLEIIVGETKRIERLVSRLSAFELFSAPQLAPLNIHLLLDRIVAAEKAAHGSRVQFTRVYDPSLPEIEGDEDHLHEAFQNIIRNGIEAAVDMQRPAHIILETAFETGFTFAGIEAHQAPSRAIRICIQDNGAGLAPERRERLFELFSPSRPERRTGIGARSASSSPGRGLGLNVVHEIISAHKGRIQIESEPGETRFSVYLPLQRKAGK